MRNSWGFSQDYSVAACDIMDVITFLFFLAKRQESKARNSFGPPEFNLPTTNKNFLFEPTARIWKFQLKLFSK